MKIKIDEAKALSKRVLKKIGYDESESEIISDSLIWAQRRESNQGLAKLFGWRVNKLVNASAPVVEKTEDGLVLINANNNHHTLACKLAVDQILLNIKSKTIFVAGVKNTHNSAGALGYYTEMLTKSGYVAIMMSAADPGVVAYGGNRLIFGTNPISIAVPNKNNPVLLDMSTAALTWGDLLKYESESKPLPEGVAFDTNGNPTTDPKMAMDGWVTTFDKTHKSSGLALMIQILAGPLIGSLYSKDYKECQYGSLIIAINPKSFGDEALFEDRVASMIKDVKASGPAPGFDEVLTPGEAGYRRAAKSQDTILILDNLYKKITDFLK